MTRARPRVFRFFPQQPRHRDLALGVVSALVAFALTSSCGADAKGVDACRDIEEARCEAAPACTTLVDVAGCRRFYRDHCLHGLSVDEAPPQDRVDRCVATIQRAGKCAKGNPDATLAVDCPNVTTGADGAFLACDIVREPERAAECDFLGPAGPALPNPNGEGGQGGGG